MYYEKEMLHFTAGNLKKLYYGFNKFCKSN